VGGVGCVRGRELAQANDRTGQLLAELDRTSKANSDAIARLEGEKAALTHDREGVVADVDRLVVQVQELERYGCVGVRHVRLGARCVTELVVCWLDTIAHWGVVGPGSSRELSNVKANGEAQVAALAEAQQANTTLQSQMVRSLYTSRPCMMLMSTWVTCTAGWRLRH
jgi:hypothetical protein